MPLSPLNIVNASSASTNVVLLNSMANNLQASSTSPNATSAATLFGLTLNLVASAANYVSTSAQIATSASLINGLASNFIASSGALTISSSAVLYFNQLQGASNLINSLVAQGQAGYQVSS